MLVELEGRNWRVLPLEVTARAGLATGVEIDRARARKLRRELRHSEALAVALRALHARDLSTSALAERLERARVPPAVRHRVVEALVRAGALDDARFARLRAEALARRDLGDAAIRHDLESRGLDRDLVEAALGGLPPERERATRIAGARAPSSAARYLGGKGFSEDAIEAAIGEAVAEDPASALR